MTKDEALKMAIEALESITLLCDDKRWYLIGNARKACKEALEQPSQEPVSLGDFDNMTKAECVDYIEYLRKEIDLLRFKEFVGLSDDEIDVIANSHLEYDMDLSKMDNFARAIEQALKEKNT